MRNFLSICLLAFLSTTTVFSQNKKDVLLSIDGEPVYVKEFNRVYKKNLDLVQDESQKDIDGYLQLFIDYKLKVAEARSQSLDKDETYVKELSQYRDQLSRQYLAEDKITDGLSKEAYERSKVEINASHILVLVSYDAMPQDTLAAYNKIKNIRERAVKGEDFTELAKKHSEEPNAAETAGDLGYFSVFKMVYPFETEAYNTKMGEVSNIVRTQFGYHIIKVKDRRKRVPKIEVSHIMISEQRKERNFNPQERIQEIYTLLEQGESFESLAKQFSDDKSSGANGGELKAFTRGDLRSTEFEEAAYDLKNPGEISKPVKSSFGWHIIKLNKILPEESYESQKEMLDKQVEGGDRSKVVFHAVNKKIMDKYGFKEGESYLPFFDSYITEEVYRRKWEPSTIAPADDKTLFTIGNRALKFSDFANYISIRQKSTKPYRDKGVLLKDFYEEFVNQSLTDYFKDQLEDENDNYAAVLDEYRNGLLIFDVMNRNIWQKAKNDTIGLQNFYSKSKNNYLWKQRVAAEIYSATSNAVAQKIQGMLNNNKSLEEIKSDINKDGTVNVLTSTGAYEVDSDDLPKKLDVKKGVSDIYTSNNSYIVLKINEILAPSTKSLDDVRGKVLSDYQNHLEEEWMTSIRAKFNVDVNKKALKRIKKDLK